MRRIFCSLIVLTGSVYAQVEGPTVTFPSAVGASASLTEIAFQGQANQFSFGAQDGYIERDQAMPKNVGQGPTASAPTPSLTVLANTPVLQTTNPRPSLGATIIQNCEAEGLGFPSFSIAGAPPDTTLAVSSTQIVQWVNSQIAVFDKSCNPLLPAPGFIQGNSIWVGLGAGNVCHDFNRGDPIVQYDRQANRWVLSQFAFNGNPSSGTNTINHQCIAVSTTSNALGTYTLYDYSFGAQLPDYGKLGLWWDAYYISYNMFPNTGGFAGAKACAYDKPAMIAGLAAQQICFTNATDFAYLHSDMEGSTPPSPGTPNYVISWNWYQTLAPYTMQLRKFVPNFVTPASSTFSDGLGGPAFSFVGFTLDAGTITTCNDNGSGACIPQPGTAQTLDTLSDRQMYRLAYRNFGGYDTLVFTQSVDPAGGQVAAVRWWEIRNPGANPPVVYQNSTYSPGDGLNRWMGSGATDKLGNFAMGYSVGSGTTPPSIRLAGKLRTEPRNILRGEQSVLVGTGSQTATLSRWGDYSTMQIDPADDCTFWYTTEYIATNGTFNWHTRIVGFKYPNCQ